MNLSPLKHDASMWEVAATVGAFALAITVVGKLSGSSDTAIIQELLAVSGVIVISAIVDHLHGIRRALERMKT